MTPDLTADCYYYRFTDDNRLIRVDQLITGTARLNIGPTDMPTYDNGW